MIAPSSDTLERSRRLCTEITRTRARNFYHGLRLTPEPRRSAVFSVYAWMRAADDIADEPGVDPDEASRRLDAFWERTDAVFAGLTPESDGLWPALADTLARYPIRRDWLRSVVLGLASDLRGEPMADDETLRLYCYRVAGTVGLICTSIWGMLEGVDRREAEALAIERGRAFQLVNILRDLGEDLSMDPARVYLPATALAGYGLDARSLRTWARPDACADVVRRYAAEARAALDRSEPLTAMIDPPCRPVLRVMTAIYAGILAKLEANPAQSVGDRRVRLSPLAKVRIVVTETVRGRLGASAGSPS